MSETSLTIVGLDELKALLRELPRELAEEAAGIIERRGAAAEGRIKANYEAHRFTGHLADSVRRTTVNAGEYGYDVEIRVKGPHALWFEEGTAARHTSKGEARGVMPPAPPMHRFVPVMEHERRAMYDDLAALLKAHGLEVTRDGG